MVQKKYIIIIVFAIVLAALGIMGVIRGYKVEYKEVESGKETKSTVAPKDDLEEGREMDKQGRVEELLFAMTLEEKVAQLFVITPEALTGCQTVTGAGNTTKEAINDCPVGGLVFFSQNIVSKEQVTNMLASQQAYSKERIGLPLFLSVDEEGGQVTRIAGSEIDVPVFANLSEIGEEGNVEKAYEIGDEIGAYLAELGFNLNFAPNGDVLTNPENTVVKYRSFGDDAKLVSEMAVSQFEGLKAHGIYGCPKHFPGHGATLGDTHKGYSYTDKSLEEMQEEEMLPFIECIKNGVSFLMAGHIAAPGIIGDDTPSSLSHTMITGILREKLGYEGIVITDALNMGAITNEYTSAQAAVAALHAGVDLLLMPEDFKEAYTGILTAVQEGTVTEERIDESLYRILAVKLEMTEPGRER